jgi:hypothetical protein
MTRSQTFGHGFRAWAVYQRIILRMPFRMISQAMEELFEERASAASIVNFIESFAQEYRPTESILVSGKVRLSRWTRRVLVWR